MNKTILRRIFAWIALVGAGGAAVFITLYFFNLFGSLNNLFAVLSMICISITIVFFILAKYVLAEPVKTEFEEDAEDAVDAEAGDVNSDGAPISDDSGADGSVNGNTDSGNGDK